MDVQKPEWFTNIESAVNAVLDPATHTALTLDDVKALIKDYVKARTAPPSDEEQALLDALTRDLSRRYFPESGAMEEIRYRIMGQLVLEAGANPDSIDISSSVCFTLLLTKHALKGNVPKEEATGQAPRKGSFFG